MYYLVIIIEISSSLQNSHMWIPGGDSSFSTSTRSKLAVAIAKGRQIVKPSASNAECKIFQHKQEDNCKTETQARSTII